MSNIYGDVVRVVELQSRYLAAQGWVYSTVHGVQYYFRFIYTFMLTYRMILENWIKLYFC